MTPEALAWYLHGEHGTSSQAIFDRLTFGQTRERWHNHPSNPDDFRRCELLLRAVPEYRERLSEMARLSDIWGRLVEHWQEIADLMETEMPGVFTGRDPRGRCPLAYALMSRLIYPEVSK